MTLFGAVAAINAVLLVTLVVWIGFLALRERKDRANGTDDRQPAKEGLLLDTVRESVASSKSDARASSRQPGMSMKGKKGTLGFSTTYHEEEPQ